MSLLLFSHLLRYTYAVVPGLNRSFVLEKDKGCLEGLMLCPVDRGAIYLAKMMGNIIFILLMEAIALSLFLALLTWELLPISPSGHHRVRWGGDPLRCISVNPRAREVMLPLLLFAVIVLVTITAVKATGLSSLGAL